MTGKDFLVEFPFSKPEGPYTLNNRPIPLSCYIQVKTVTHGINRSKRNLKSAEYLVREFKPTFIVVVRLDKNGDMSHIYMVHIYDNIISAILKKLRERHAKKSFNIGRDFISFSLNNIVAFNPVVTQ